MVVITRLKDQPKHYKIIEKASLLMRDFFFFFFHLVFLMLVDIKAPQGRSQHSEKNVYNVISGELFSRCVKNGNGLIHRLLGVGI